MKHENTLKKELPPVFLKKLNLGTKIVYKREDTAISAV